MPAFQCPACDQVFRAERRPHVAPVVVCPHCGQQMLLPDATVEPASPIEFGGPAAEPAAAPPAESIAPAPRPPAPPAADPALPSAPPPLPGKPSIDPPAPTVEPRASPAGPGESAPVVQPTDRPVARTQAAAPHHATEEPVHSDPPPAAEIDSLLPPKFTVADPTDRPATSDRVSQGQYIAIPDGQGGVVHVPQSIGVIRHQGRQIKVHVQDKQQRQQRQIIRNIVLILTCTAILALVFWLLVRAA